MNVQLGSFSSVEEIQSTNLVTMTIKAVAGCVIMMYEYHSNLGEGLHGSQTMNNNIIAGAGPCRRTLA